MLAPYMLTEFQQSPPPEPTPSPPPLPPPPPARQVSQVSSHGTPGYRRTSEVDPVGGISHTPIPAPSTSRKNHSQSNAQQHAPRHPQHSASPAPVHQQQQGQPATPGYPQSGHPSVQASASLDHYSTPGIRYSRPQSSHRPSNLPGTSIPPRPSEVYHLSDTANASIPESIRKEFQRDDQGHVLFFDRPPLDVLPPVKRGTPIGHTAAYLAAKIRKRLGLKDGEMPTDPKSSVISSQEPASKKPKLSHNAEASASFIQQVNKTRDQALEILICQLDQGTEAIYKDLYGEHWKEGMKYEKEKLEAAQKERRELNAEIAESARKRKENNTVSLRGTGVFLDDIDPRY